MNKITVRELIGAVYANDENSCKAAYTRFNDILDTIIPRISDRGTNCGNGVFFRFRDIPDKFRTKPLLAVSDVEINGVPTLIVGNPKLAWVNTSAHILRKDKSRSVAITGSVGKTTVKDIIYHVLNKGGNAIRCHNSVNGARGLCLAVTSAEKKIDYFSCEMGLNHPQNHFPVISEALQPEICVITNIGHCHIENFRDKEHILECKLRCADHLSKETGLLLINADDELLMAHKYEHKVKTFALKNTDADYHCENVRLSNSTVDFTAVCPDRKLEIHLNVPGEHNIYGALAAIAAGEKLGISDENIISGLADFTTYGIRQNVYTVHDNITVINDCSGSSPEANTVAFNMLANMKTEFKGQRKIALLGHIIRMGRLSEQLHRELGKKLAEYNFDMIVTYGGKSSLFTDEVKAAGGVAHHFYDDAEFVDFVKRNLRPNDIVLCKGGQKSYAFYKYVEQIFDENFTPVLATYYGSHCDTPELHVASPAMAVMNSESRELLSGKNMHERRNVANLFSLLTAITALENMDSSEIVIITEKVHSLSKGCRKYGLKVGEQYVLSDLIWIALNKNAADAVYAIALHYSENPKRFMQLVNKTLRHIGAANTNCVGPYGKIYDNYYSTAYDMALIAAHAMNNTDFRHIISRKSISVMDLSTQSEKVIEHHTKLNTPHENDEHVLYSPEITVLKEGGNSVSGRCIVAVRKCTDHSEAYHVAVVLGTIENEFTKLSYCEIKTLLENCDI